MHFCSFSEKILKRVKVMGLKVDHHLRARIYYYEGLLEKYPPPKKRNNVSTLSTEIQLKIYPNFTLDSHLFLVSKYAKAATTNVLYRHQVNSITETQISPKYMYYYSCSVQSSLFEKMLAEALKNNWNTIKTFPKKIFITLLL